MQIMQLAESIERVIGVRNATNPTDGKHKQSILENNVPSVLKRAYKAIWKQIKSTESEKGTIPFAGKELLLSFDPSIGLENTWVDAVLFEQLNRLRNDMARRQNFGRGLPVQLSAGYTSKPAKNCHFDVDHKSVVDP